MRIITGLEELATLAGQEIACSDWLAIDQARIDRFAEATGDRQWIHVDPDRARRESPYKATIAHGYLTLSLVPHLIASCIHIDGLAMAINYGLDRVRLPAPVVVGSRLRVRVVLDRVEAIAGGAQATWSATVELEHGDKPACVAQMVARYYPVAAHS